MTGLLGPNGSPISSKQFKKAPPPLLGEKFGDWGGEHTRMLQLPGGGFLQFNLDTLTLNDYRQMKDNYQINSSLSILTFMMHQIEWNIECSEQKIADECTRQLTNLWPQLVRAKSQANWAGYSPNVLQWENDVYGNAVVLTKIKDLIPEDCMVNWKKPNGSQVNSDNEQQISPRIKIYDGIKQAGWPKTIPVENSYWYPLLMENGNYYGRKLLRPAFQPWFFSILLHLFSNRYFERFGEPTPVGRAPFDEQINMDGKEIKSQDAMGIMLQKLKSRAVVVMPDDRTPIGNETSPNYDYQIEYLESQMRGADFEKYMTRLDEEMSLALFTPILMMRTADVGSYNLGVGHTQTYMTMLNALVSDWANYINKYILRPIARYNSNRGEQHPEVRIKFRKLGKDSSELVRDIIAQGFRDGRYKLDTKELSDMVGMDVIDGGVDPFENPTPDETAIRKDGGKDQEVITTSKKISARIAQQVEKAYNQGVMPNPNSLSFGFEDQLARAFTKAGSPYGGGIAAGQFYRTCKGWMIDANGMPEEFPTAESYMTGLRSIMNYESKRLCNG